MNAIEYLTDQHVEIDSLFDQFESASAGGGRTRLRLCWRLGDLVAAHLWIEETMLHRPTKRGSARALVERELEEHVSMKELASQIAEVTEANEVVAAKVATLRDLKRRHAGEEERELFPFARQILAAGWLCELGRRMEQKTNELLEESRRERELRRSAGGSRPVRASLRPWPAGPEEGRSDPGESLESPGLGNEPAGGDEVLHLTPAVLPRPK